MRDNRKPPPPPLYAHRRVRSSTSSGVGYHRASYNGVYAIIDETTILSYLLSVRRCCNIKYCTQVHVVYIIIIIIGVVLSASPRVRATGGPTLRLFSYWPIEIESEDRNAPKTKAKTIERQKKHRVSLAQRTSTNIDGFNILFAKRNSNTARPPPAV